MGYNNEALKALTSGSGKAPAIFTYTTPNTIAEITTLGYFDDNGGSGIFEPNDIIYAVPLDGGAFAKIICVQNDKSAGLGEKLNFSTTTSFAGDTRATDEAGYQSDNFGVGIGSGQGVFMQHTYRNNTDTKALILGDDYFIEAGLFLEIGDIIEIVAKDGHTMATVLTTGTAGVTLREIVFV